MKTRSIGLVLETQDDAIDTGTSNLIDAYHWREPMEIAVITEAIEAAGHKVVVIGTPRQLCLEAERYLRKIDFIFNLSVGFISRYRLALGPALYELLKMPYSGADPYTKMISQNKHMMKSFWDKIGISTPQWVYIGNPRDLDSQILPDYPVIVKPAHEGSSIGINIDSVVSDSDELHKKVSHILESLGMPVILEKFIEGREFRIGIIGNEEIDFLGITEDVKPDGQSMGNELLYFDLKKAGKCSKKPHSANDPEFRELVDDAIRTYQLFLPVDYGTMDARIDADGKHHFLEFNADATLHPSRTLSQCCQLNGLDFQGMINKILETSLKRWNIR